VFDQLGAVDGGDQPIRHRASGAFRRVNRAVECPVQHRLVDFLHLLFSEFAFHAHHDPVRMQEVSHSGSLAEEFRIRRHLERNVRFSAVGRKGALQFLSRSRRHGALFDHELGLLGFGRDHARHMIDGAQVRIAIGQRRSPHANEESISECDRIGRVGAELQTAVLARFGDHVLEPGLVDRHSALFERLNLARVIVGAHDLVADARKAGACD
jgi:hypothetical protein